MTEYTVTWEVQLDADTPLQAAAKAWTMLTRPGTTANVFEVGAVEIDLQEVINLRPDGRLEIAHDVRAAFEAAEPSRERDRAAVILGQLECLNDADCVLVRGHRDGCTLFATT